jgi:hypothetical protein
MIEIRQIFEITYGEWMCAVAFIELAALSLVFEYA